MADRADPVSVEMLKLAVEMADRVSARRATSNAFYLTVQSTLVAASSIATDTLAAASVWVTIVLACTGVALSAAWWLQLRSYRALNRAKFEVIFDLEAALGVSVFSREWEYLRRDSRGRRRYAELGTVERVVPIVFAVLYVILSLVRILQ